MTDPFFHTSARDFKSMVIALPDQTITWAGEGIMPDTFLLGTENGQLIECGIDGPIENSRPVQVTAEKESINAVAHFFFENELHVGITTRTEIAVHRFSAGSHRSDVFRRNFGAHGIKRSMMPGFVVPAGPSGLVVLMPNARGNYDCSQSPNQNVYLYDLCMLGVKSENGAERWMAACRKEGLIAIETKIGAKPNPTNRFNFKDEPQDFVGVISIGDASKLWAFVALEKSRRLHFLGDVFRSQATHTVHLPFVPGTAYKILSYNNHILMLTSRGLCIIPDLIREFHTTGLSRDYRNVKFMDVEAMDINIAFDKWLLILTPDGVMRIDLSEYLRSKPIVDFPSVAQRQDSQLLARGWTDSSSLSPVAVTDWESRDVEWKELDQPQAVSQGNLVLRAEV